VGEKRPQDLYRLQTWVEDLIDQDQWKKPGNCRTSETILLMQFLPHQVWRVWFLVACVISDTAPIALLANDMGLEKTYIALDTLLHLKWILSEASAGWELGCIGGHSVEDLDNVPPFFSFEK
jgi:hypothetical protein